MDGFDIAYLTINNIFECIFEYKNLFYVILGCFGGIFGGKKGQFCGAEKFFKKNKKFLKKVLTFAVGCVIIIKR